MTRILLLVAVTVVMGALWYRSDRPRSAPQPRTRPEEQQRIARAFGLPREPALLSGTVRGEDGTAIPNATVCATCATCNLVELPRSACTRSDAQGTYSLTTGGARSLLISANAEGFSTGYANRGLPVACHETPQSGLDISLRSGGVRLAGSVLDALGGPIAQARVLIERLEGSLRVLQETQTDGEGRFALPTVPGWMTVRAEVDGYAPNAKTVRAPASDVELQLTPASVIRGRVVAATTRGPIAGAEVRALPDGFPATAAPAITREDGSFELGGLEPGHYALSAAHPRWRGLAAPVEVRLTDVVADVVVEALPAVRVLGHVVAEGAQDSEPCAAGSSVALEARDRPDAAAQPARVTGMGLLAPIEADGLVRFDGVPQGAYTATVRCSERIVAEGPAELTVDEHDLEVRWTLRPGLGLKVQVIDEAGRSVAHAPLLLRMPSPRQPDAYASTSLHADANGIGEIRGELRPGKYTIQPAGGLEGEPVSVELRERQPPAALTLRLAGSGSIIVVARDEAGDGVSGLQVTATSDAPSTEVGQRQPSMTAASPMSGRLGLVQAREEGNGHYRLGPLKSGPYKVRVEDGVNPALTLQGTQDGHVQVAAGATLTHEVRVERGGKLRGTVVDERGAPEAEVWVSASAEDGQPSLGAQQLLALTAPPRTMTDAEGRFELTHLQRGARYTLKAKQPYENAVAHHGALEGQTVRIVLPRPASLSGRVLDAQGRPGRRVHVEARHGETNTRRSASTDDSGDFEIEQLPAGPVVVAAFDAGRFARRELTLAAGQRASGLQLTLAGEPQPSQLPTTKAEDPNATRATQLPAASDSTPAGSAEIVPGG